MRRERQRGDIPRDTPLKARGSFLFCSEISRSDRDFSPLVTRTVLFCPTTRVDKKRYFESKLYLTRTQKELDTAFCLFSIALILLQKERLSAWIAYCMPERSITKQRSCCYRIMHFEMNKSLQRSKIYIICAPTPTLNPFDLEIHRSVVNVIPFSLASAATVLLLFLSGGIMFVLTLNISFRRTFISNFRFGGHVLSLVVFFAA